MSKLIACPDCGEQISAKADACPKCGREIRGSFMKRLFKGYLWFLLIAFVGLLGSCVMLFA
jgi:predicted amidophosphoribosyltransferase